MYIISCGNYYETVLGYKAVDPVHFVETKDDKEAMKIAKELVDKKQYDTITIVYNHPEEAACYLNPTGDHESVGKCWVDWYQ